MTSMRESPIRRQRRERPPWLMVVLGVVAVIVVVGLGVAIASMVRGGSEDAQAEGPDAAPSPCVTTMVASEEILPAAAKVKVNVYNATDTSGLASKTATDMEDRGFRIGEVANDPVGMPIDGVARIRFGPKGAKSAQLVLIYVPGAELVPLDRKGKTVDLAVGDGFTGLAQQEEVTAQLTTPTPVASGPGCPSATP